MSRVAMVIGTVWLVVTIRMGFEVHSDYAKRQRNPESQRAYNESLHAFAITEIQLIAAALILSRLLMPRTRSSTPHSAANEASMVKSSV